MKKAIAIVLSVAFLFAAASFSIAADEKKATPAPAADMKKAAPAEEKKAAPAMEEKKAPAKVKQVHGNVTAVDAKAKTVTVKGKKGDVVIAVDDKMIADIKVGDYVVVQYIEADGKNIAKSMKKLEAKPEEQKTDKKVAPVEKK